jgi:hypothetical protein
MPGRSAIENRVDYFSWASRKKKVGPGVVNIRTRRGCSIWQSGEARRLPANHSSAGLIFLPPN